MVDKVKLESYAIRITRDYETLNPWINDLVSFSTTGRLVVYQHDADDEVSRTHCHLLLKDVKRNTATTVTLKRRLAKLTNQEYAVCDWSFKTTYGEKKTPVDDAFISYMSKGSLSPSFVIGYTKEQIEEYSADGYTKADITTKRQSRLRFESQSIPRKTQYAMFSELKIRCLEQKLDSRGIEPIKLIDLIRDFLKTQKIMFTASNVVNFYHMLVAEYDPDKFSKDCENLLQKFERRY